MVTIPPLSPGLPASPVRAPAAGAPPAHGFATHLARARQPPSRESPTRVPAESAARPTPSLATEPVTRHPSASLSGALPVFDPRLSARPVTGRPDSEAAGPTSLPRHRADPPGGPPGRASVRIGHSQQGGLVRGPVVHAPRRWVVVPSTAPHAWSVTTVTDRAPVSSASLALASAAWPRLGLPEPESLRSPHRGTDPAGPASPAARGPVAQLLVGRLESTALVPGASAAPVTGPPGSAHRLSPLSADVAAPPVTLASPDLPATPTWSIRPLGTVATTQHFQLIPPTPGPALGVAVDPGQSTVQLTLPGSWAEVATLVRNDPAGLAAAVAPSGFTPQHVRVTVTGDERAAPDGQEPRPRFSGSSSGFRRRRPA